jgi:hypothetical protein
MGRARERNPTGNLRKRRFLPVIAVGGLLACGSITGDFGRIIAIQLTGDPARSLLEGSTLQLDAVALDASGDSVPDAEIFWNILDVDSLVGFTLDTSTGMVVGVTPSSARVQARVGNLRSGALTVTVTAAPDSLTATSNLVLSIAGEQTRSPAILVQVLDLTTMPGEALGLAGITVQYTLPGGPEASAFLTLADSATGDGTSVEAQTSGTGTTQAFLGLAGVASQPDSVIVEASVLSAANTPIPGSPIRFTIVFGQSL